MGTRRWFSTPPLDIIDKPAEMHHYDAITAPLWRRIVLHATAGTNSLDWLTRTSSPPVSVHRLIARDGTIYKIVDDRFVAFHVGFATLFPYAGRGLINANYTSLGIELENLNDGKQDYSPKQLTALLGQVLEWYGAYGYLPMVSHSDLDPRKSDPRNFPWEAFMGELSRGIARILH